VLQLLGGPVQPFEPLRVPPHLQEVVDMQVHQVRALVPGCGLGEDMKNTLNPCGHNISFG
jgi:hypothetical protein